MSVSAAFLQQVMVPNNMDRRGINEQVCFVNYNELHGVRRGTIFGVNAAALNRWKTVGEEHKGEPTLPPPFDKAGMTNHQIILEKAVGDKTSPDQATAAQRALGAMKCGAGLKPVWRGSGVMRTVSGNPQAVSVWQCVVPGSAQDRVRTRSILYA